MNFDLGGGQPEIHRHQDPAPAGHPEERGQQPRRVVGHDGYPLAHPHAEPVETGGLGPAPGGHAGEGERFPRCSGLAGLVDQPYPIRIGGLGPIEEVPDIELNDHRSP